MQKCIYLAYPVSLISISHAYLLVTDPKSIQGIKEA